jgi:hypothetical protein
VDSRTPSSGLGEPLWCVSCHPGEIRQNLYAAETCENGRLPRITQRHPFTLGFRFLAVELPSVEMFPGAACFHILRRHAFWEEFRERGDKYQSGSPAIGGWAIGRSSGMLVYSRTRTTTSTTLNNLDFPALIDRISDGLNHLHVFQTFTETGLR